MFLILKNIALFQGIIFFTVCLTPIWAKPYIPQDDEHVLEYVPVLQGPFQQQLDQLRQAWKSDPQNLSLALRLTKEYRELGRTQGDPRYYGYAQATLAPWWDLPNPPSEVLLLRGILRQAQHDFVGALEDIASVLRVQPGNAQAWLTQAVIFQVRGDFERAQRSCRPLVRLTSILVATTCKASTESLSGRAKESYALLKSALQKSTRDPPKVKLWALTVLAEIATRLGDIQSAEHHFTHALSLGIPDTYLLGAYCNLLLDTGRAVEVPPLLQKNTHSDGLLLRLALAEQQLKVPEMASRVQNLQMRFAESRLRGDNPHLRVKARFTLHLLNQPEEALALARQNWEIQREPADIRILLEAALKSDNPKAAQPVIQWIKSVRLEDVRLQKLIARFP